MSKNETNNEKHERDFVEVTVKLVPEIYSYYEKQMQAIRVLSGVELSIEAHLSVVLAAYAAF